MRPFVPDTAQNTSAVAVSSTDPSLQSAPPVDPSLSPSDTGDSNQPNTSGAVPPAGNGGGGGGDNGTHLDLASSPAAALGLSDNLLLTAMVAVFALLVVGLVSAGGYRGSWRQH